MAAEVAAPVASTYNIMGGTYPYYQGYLNNEEQDKMLADALLKIVAEQEVSDLREVIKESKQCLLDAQNKGDPQQIKEAETELKEVNCETAHFFGDSSDEKKQIQFSLKQIQAERPIELSVRVLEFNDSCNAEYMQHVNAFLRLHAVEIKGIKDTDPDNWGLTPEYFYEKFDTIDRVMSLLDLCHVV